MAVASAELRSRFGEIDIYLFDQILKGRFDCRLRVLDAGCGDGRNLIYFLQCGFAGDRGNDQPARERLKVRPALRGMPTEAGSGACCER